MCDCPAAKCKQWGTGLDPTDHCNGHPGSDVHAAQKRLRQQQAAQRAGPAEGAAPAAEAASRPNVIQRAIDALAGRMRLPGSAGKKGKAAHLKAGRFQPYSPEGKPKAAARPCRLTVMPDPSADRDMMLVVRAAGGVEGVMCRLLATAAALQGVSRGVSAALVHVGI